MAGSRLSIAIVGGGFSGTMVAAHLLRSAPEGTTVHLIERRPPVGRGVAYGTRYDSHVLNVRASGMSALPDDPSHFVRWSQARPELFERPVEPVDFVSRRVYGIYVQSVIEEAASSTAHGVSLVRWSDEAVDLRVADGRGALSLESGESLEVDRVVLAIGHFPPGHPPVGDRGFYSSERYVGDPWSRGHLDALHRDDSVLLIGSGLTALDLALAMRERGHRGVVHMISRSGRLPQPHRVVAPYRDFLAGEALPPAARPLVRRVREELMRAAAEGVDWRAVLDAIRPHTQAIWRGLSAGERRRLLRHVRSFWETHRHRMPPQVEAMAEELQRSGRLCLHAGRLLAFEESGHCVYARYRKRGSGEEETLVVDRVVNCTGPECDYRRMRHPLLASLLGRGLVRPDDLALGLETDDRGALVGSDGSPSEVLFTLGPLRKGTLWETTAVPEIRVQARDLACELSRF